MGQKINPRLFRLGFKNNKWDSSYLEKNCEESTLLISNDLKIRNFIFRVLELQKLLLHSCKIRYTLETVTVSINYCKLLSVGGASKESLKQEEVLKNLILKGLYLFMSKSINRSIIYIRLKDLDKEVKNKQCIKLSAMRTYFRRFAKDPLFDELLNIVLITILFTNSASLLVGFLVIKFRNIKTQNKILFYLKLLLLKFIKTKFSKIKGLKLIISGRFNKAQRSRKKTLLMGSVPLQTIKAKIDYSQSTVFTSVGTFGIKLWTCKRIIE